MTYLLVIAIFVMGIGIGTRSVKAFYISFLTAAISRQLLIDNTDEKDIISELKKINLWNIIDYLFNGLYLSLGR